MSKNSKIGKCNLCGEHKKLIKAHIIPQFLFKEHYLCCSPPFPYPIKSRIGTYDSNILYAKCDNDVIGKFDDFACETLF